MHPQLQRLEGFGVDGSTRGIACFGCEPCGIMYLSFIGVDLMLVMGSALTFPGSAANFAGSG